MGLITDQDGILRRFINESPNWDEHLNNTKRVITKFIKEKHAKTISILGSGWMLDIPIYFLAKEMERVVFYDLRHPLGVIDKYERFSNFQFIETDLTGGLIEKAYNLCHRKNWPSNEELEQELIPIEMIFPIETELIVSVNLVNQLDILIVDYLKKYFRLSAESIIQIRKNIQGNHLKILKPQHSCLITDVEEIHLDDMDEEVGSVPLVFCEMPRGESEKNWIWHFDTQKTYHPEFRTYMKVKSMYL